MKNLLVAVMLAAVVLTVTGCGTSLSKVIDPLPNTGRGFWQDVAGTANAMTVYHNNHVFENEATDIPVAVALLEDRVSWLDKVKATLKRLQGTVVTK